MGLVKNSPSHDITSHLVTCQVKNLRISGRKPYIILLPLGRESPGVTGVVWRCCRAPARAHRRRGARSGCPGRAQQSRCWPTSESPSCSQGRCEGQVGPDGPGDLGMLRGELEPDQGVCTVHGVAAHQRRGRAVADVDGHGSSLFGFLWDGEMLLTYRAGTLRQPFDKLRAGLRASLPNDWVCPKIR